MLLGLFVMVGIILATDSHAQQVSKLKFKHISIEQGLSSSTVESIFQDSRGFIWFGTRDGLNRFDGYQMVVYRYNPADTNSISDNFIRYLYEDSNNVLWVGTNNGLNRFNAGFNNFTRYKNNPSNPNSISNNIVNCIYEDKDHKLWISTYGGGINLFQPERSSFRNFRNKMDTRNSILDNKINFFYEDSKNNFWVATENGLTLFNKQNGSFRPYNFLPEQTGANKKYIIRIIAEDRKGNLYLGTESNGLIIFNYQQKMFKQYLHKEKDASSLASNLIRSILIDQKDNVWIGSINGGIDKFDERLGIFTHYQNSTDDPFSLSQRTVSSLFEDNQGNIWAGTHRGGVNLFMPNTEKFSLYQQESSKNSLSYNDVKAFCEDKAGNIWIGTDGGGLNLFNRVNKTFKHFYYSPYNKNTLGSNEVLDIAQDSEENIWVATWGGGLCLYNKKSGGFTRFVNNVNDSTSISSDYVQQVFEDSRKNLWVATYYGGLNLLDRKTKKFKRVIHGKNNTRLEGNNIVALNEDRFGNLWIGTDDGGLNCFDAKKQIFDHYFSKEEKMPDIRVIFINSKGELWIGQTGLYKFNYTKKTFELYTTKANLNNDFIKGITEDERGNFWISSSNGLIKFHPDSLSFKRYNAADGLQGLEFEANAYLKTKDGEMFFGGLNGFNTFYPENITENTFLPPVYVTDFQLFNKRILPGEPNSPLQTDISVTNEISLLYDQSTFSFSFAALNYSASENNQYAYKLENWDKDWNYVGTERKAAYTNLSPGTYTFRLKAANNDGLWNENGQSITIYILPPLWGTWWFRLLVIAIFTTFFIFLLRFKQKLDLRKLNETKREEIHQMQLQFFTNISHEFRTPLSLILGPLEKLQKEDKNSSHSNIYKVMYRNAKRLMNLINELMDFRKTEAGVLKLNVMPCNMRLFLNEVAEEFSELATQKSMNFSIDVPEELGEVWLDRQITEKIITNLLSNAFKYTEQEGNISIRALNSLNNFVPAFKNELLIKNDYISKNYIYLIVKDNGIGISKESISHLFERFYKITETHLGSGIGLAFVKSLTLLHKGFLQVYSERNKGTEIIIALPSAKIDYSNEERWIKDKEMGARLESMYMTDFETLEEPTQITFTNPKPSQKIPHLLIVDDNDELRTFLKESLKDQYNISEAIDGFSGLKITKEVFPDLIISDVMMPGMDGIEFCKKIKEDIESCHIPFLMLTAKDAIESRIEGVESGADYYFSKPLRIDLLELTIKNIFNQKQKSKEKYFKDYYSEAKELVHSSKDKEFMNQLILIIEEHLSNPDMNIDYICTQIGMSRTKLYQKIKNITGQPIGDFIRTIRLKKAAHLMTHQDSSLTDIMYSVGLQTQSYFTKAFKKEFGKTPSQFMKDIQRVKT